MPKKSQTTKKTENRNTDAVAAEASPTTGRSSHPGKKILSIAIEPALHSKLALLARCEGRSVTDLVVEAVSKNLKGRIATALEALKADIDK